jgi:hypothetical protein
MGTDFLSAAELAAARSLVFFSTIGEIEEGVYGGRVGISVGLKHPWQVHFTTPI